METAKSLIYFADPMCSWCWGFSPVMAAICDTIGMQADIRLVVGGLRAGATRPMSAEAKTSVRRHWQEVEQATGQPFSYSFFERSEFVYDTEPACRAIVVMRSFAPDAALAYLHTVQRAFYVQGRDVTKLAELASLAEAFGLDVGTFNALYDAPEVIRATRADFAATHSAGITGFPTVILRKDNALVPLAIGYRSFEAVKANLDLWLAA